MNKRTAIRECKKLWEEIEKSYHSKYYFIYNTSKGMKWAEKDYNHNCPLCELTQVSCIRPRHDGGNRYPKECRELCPLFLQYGKGCYGLGFNDDTIPSQRWLNAIKGLKE